MAVAINRIPARSKYLMAHLRNPARHTSSFCVSLREAAAVNYWCAHFATTPERLLEAVRRVGTNPEIVRLELRAI